MDNLLIASDSVSIQANCASFDEVYQWQRELERTAGFARVDVQNPQKDSQSETVKFKLVLTVGKAEQHDASQ